MTSGIPRRPFGQSGVEISALGLGGHHLGDVPSSGEAIRLVHEAIDGGITFFDNCWEYHNGKSELYLGEALRGKRQQVFLMTKVCTHGRDGRLGLHMLEESLRRLETDHLDLWQIHGMGFDTDPRLAFAKGGIVEAMLKAKRAGKVRFLGFTGHKSPDVHAGMLTLASDAGVHFDAVQMPLNPFDAGFVFSFEKKVLPALTAKGIAPLGMKSFGGKGDALKKGVLTPAEALRYAMSLPVATTISGIDSLEVLRQNLAIAQSFTPFSGAEMQAVREKCRPFAADGRFEVYKTSLSYDNPEARRAHGFSVDLRQKETKEELESVQNSSKPH